MYDKLVIVVLISSVTIYSMTSSAEKPKIVSNYLGGWENYQMTLIGFSEKKIHIVCLVCPNFQGDFFSDLHVLYQHFLLTEKCAWWKSVCGGRCQYFWFQHHDSLPCRSAGAGLGFSPSSCLPQPRLGPLHMVPHHCQPSFVSTSRSDLMFFSVCSSEPSPESLQLWECWCAEDMVAARLSLVEALWVAQRSPSLCSLVGPTTLPPCTKWGKILFYLSIRSPLAKCRDGSWLVAKAAPGS